MNKQTVLGLQESIEQADQSAEALNRIGLGSEQVSIVTAEAVVQERLGGDAKRSFLESAGVGAAGGGAVGGLIGLLVGATLLLFPGIGPVLASGSLAVALATTAAGAGIGAFHGGFAGALIALGLDEENAHNYVESVRRGQVLIAIETDEETVASVVEALQRTGAHDVDTRKGTWEVQQQPVTTQAGNEPEIDETLANLLASLAGQALDAEEGFRRAAGNVREVNVSSPVSSFYILIHRHCPVVMVSFKVDSC